VSQSARQKELQARYLLAHQEEIPVLLKEKRWAEIAVVAEFAAKDVPDDLAHTDAALYRLLRCQITEYRIRGWHLLNVEKIRQLAGKE
jgi:predicted protein tyrosine phosphatase